jgi:hypothetical protein
MVLFSLIEKYNEYYYEKSKTFAIHHDFAGSI